LAERVIGKYLDEKKVANRDLLLGRTERVWIISVARKLP